MIKVLGSLRRRGKESGAESNSGKGGSAGTGQAAGQCVTGLPGDGLQPRQLLPLQGTLRQGWRGGAGGDLAAQAGAQESSGAGNRGGRGDRNRRAGLGSGARWQRAEEVRAERVGGRGALRLAASRPRDHAQAAQGAGGEERPEGLLLSESQLAALEKAKADKEAHG